ncbi:MAG: DUF4402 domain-containing protein [Alphaproteobacteria bacterium]|jgi:hypothetical protein|nr:DUF4402 domain-containing protein [Alphaproteobacteria bacterium]
MKFFLTLFFSFLTFISTNCFAVSINGIVEAEIVSELEVSESNSIYMGTISTDGTAETVSIDSSGNVTCPPTMHCDGIPQSGKYTISGAPNAEISLDVHESTLSNSAGTETMDFTPNVGLGEARTLDGTGSHTLEIGGDLSVGANQESDTYSTSNTGGVPMLIDISY